MDIYQAPYFSVLPYFILLLILRLSGKLLKKKEGFKESYHPSTF